MMVITIILTRLTAKSSLIKAKRQQIHGSQKQQHSKVGCPLVSTIIGSLSTKGTLNLTCLHYDAGFQGVPCWKGF
jgi:hypothetical protein